jgi:hypothetical protein
LNHPTTSPEGIRRIYDDARIWVNVSKDREIPLGKPIDVSELVEQLNAEGYTKSEAKSIVESYGEMGELVHDLNGVRPAEQD